MVVLNLCVKHLIDWYRWHKCHKIVANKYSPSFKEYYCLKNCQIKKLFCTYWALIIASKVSLIQSLTFLTSIWEDCNMGISSQVVMAFTKWYRPLWEFKSYQLANISVTNTNCSDGKDRSWTSSSAGWGDSLAEKSVWLKKFLPQNTFLRGLCVTLECVLMRLKVIKLLFSVNLYVQNA